MKISLLLPKLNEIPYVQELLYANISQRDNDDEYLELFNPDSYSPVLHDSNDKTILSVLKTTDDGDCVAAWDFHSLGIVPDLYQEIIEMIAGKKIEIYIINPNMRLSFRDLKFKVFYSGLLDKQQLPPKFKITSALKSEDGKKERKPQKSIVHSVAWETRSNMRIDKKLGMFEKDILDKYSVSAYTYRKITKDIKASNKIVTYNQKRLDKTDDSKRKIPVKLIHYFSKLEGNVAGIMQRYLATKQTNITRNHYQYYIAKLYDYVESKNKGFLAKENLYVSSAKISGFFDMLKRENYNTNTVYSYYKVYKNWFQFLFYKNIIPINPIADVCKPPVGKSLCVTEHLEKQDLQRVIKLVLEDIDDLEKKTANENTIFAKKRDFVLFYIMATTGLRSGSVLQIKKSDILINEKYHVRVKMKGGYNENIILPPDTLKIFTNFVKEYSEFSPNDNFIFRQGIHFNVKMSLVKTIKYLKNVFQRLDINIVAKLHVFRVSFAVHCYQNGMSLISIRDKLYHSDVSITSRYIKRVDEFKDVQFMPKFEVVNPELVMKRKPLVKEIGASCHG